MAKGKKPERDHGREVERDDGRAHADGLADGLGIDVAADVLEDPPLHGGRDGAGRLDHLDHPPHLSPGVADRLAHLGGHRAGELLLAGDEALAKLEQLLGPVDRRHRAPLGEGERGRRGPRRRGRRRRRAAPGPATSPVAGLVTSRISVGVLGRDPAAADVVLERARGGAGHSTLCSISPSPSMAIRITSPEFRNRGGSKPWPTPLGVPVRIRSSGSERARLGDELDQLLAAEDQIAGVRVLAELAVDPGLQVEVLRILRPRPWS